ncbi:hypothetical protein C2845_PM05G03480 [Panicum miliaceum]|uniref:RNase H type-1 domain-containing protein n=1 Tax=Panicum miliaceum TaxID=4540 RepID=A0A3L6SXX8_PANMI|nr:hypothetical protein C2845_PM05G03480 [Panicum miliaceum]
MHWISWNKLTDPKEEGGLGFRDLHIFKLAMLAKQGWRLIHTPDSLCAKVLKARYFPNGEVLQAKAGRNMSYTWRSILKGIEVLNRGVIWRVGNGGSINIWSDPWLLREWSRKPITPKGHNVLTRVEELINPATGGWDDKLVQQTFWPQDLDIVLSTTVNHDLEDLVAWHYDNRGNFSVKSAYRVERDHEKRSSRRGGRLILEWKPTERWQKPIDDYVKINSDGAFSASTGEGGWGYVIRDGDGEVICAGAGKLLHQTDALQTEVRACLQGAKAAATLGISKVIFETDSLILKMAMKDNSYRLSMVGGSILEGRMCPQETDLAWNGPPSCVEEIVVSDIAESFR